MKKPKKKPNLKKLAWKTFSEYIRTRDCLKTTKSRDWGVCITCGKTFPFKKLQAGHFIPGRHNANLFSERFVNAQCWQCNAPAFLGGKNGNALAYRKAMIRMYGENAEELAEKEANQTIQYKDCDYKEIRKKFKQKLEQLLTSLPND